MGYAFVTTTVNGVILKIDFGDQIKEKDLGNIIPFLTKAKKEYFWKLLFVNNYNDAQGNVRFQYIFER